VASGGELSRIMLALKTLTAAEEKSAALIFDEVDAGVGGAVAEVIGRKLRQLGARRQVLSVTHLPVIAAFADHHIGVAKHSQAGARCRRRGHCRARNGWWSSRECSAGSSRARRASTRSSCCACRRARARGRRRTEHRRRGGGGEADMRRDVTGVLDMAMARIQGTIAIGLALTTIGVSFYALAASRRAAIADATWLRQRLGEKRALVRALQADLAVVAETTERVSQMAAIARDQNVAVRRYAQVEEARDARYTPGAARRARRRDGPSVGGRHPRARQLSFLEEQLAETTDSLALMTVLSKGVQREETMTPSRRSSGSPSGRGAPRGRRGVGRRAAGRSRARSAPASAGANPRGAAARAGTRASTSARRTAPGARERARRGAVRGRDSAATARSSSSITAAISRRSTATCPACTCGPASASSAARGRRRRQQRPRDGRAPPLRGPRRQRAGRPDAATFRRTDDPSKLASR
jgi:hypothetical protein